MPCQFKRWDDTVYLFTILKRGEEKAQRTKGNGLASDYCQSSLWPHWYKKTKPPNNQALFQQIQKTPLTPVHCATALVKRRLFPTETHSSLQLRLLPILPYSRLNYLWQESNTRQGFLFSSWHGAGLSANISQSCSAYYESIHIPKRTYR